MIRALNIDNGLQECMAEYLAVTKAKIKRAGSANFKGIAQLMNFNRSLEVKHSEISASF